MLGIISSASHADLAISSLESFIYGIEFEIQARMKFSYQELVVEDQLLLSNTIIY